MQQRITAKKSLGQHFLKSESALTKIVGAANLAANDLVLEIGPGTGVLTKRLLTAAGTVVAIEKDRELVAQLTETFAEEIASGKLKLIEGDILKFDPSSLRAHDKRSDSDYGYKLVANIPYYITGAIIEQFLSAEHQPEQMVLLMQKEVAERIVARPEKGRSKESVLSIAVKAYGIPKIIAKVPAGAFNPPPKVDSAILSIEGISRGFFTGPKNPCDETDFFKVVKFVFGKKRGQLGGRLGELFENRTAAMEVLEKCGIDPKLRPENLSIEDWKRIARTAKLLYWR